jgi:hypothetical protein
MSFEGYDENIHGTVRKAIGFWVRKLGLYIHCAFSK